MSKEKPLTMKDIYEKADAAFAECSKDFYESAKLMEAWLVEYFSDPANRAEIDASPLKGYTTDAAVGLLMQDVYSYLRRKK
jgi:hypothetical protein